MKKLNKTEQKRKGNTERREERERERERNGTRKKFRR
jgi:hypothetical protein